jgi:hypothetical protein
MEVSSQRRRIDPIRDDRKVLQRRFDGQAAWSRPGEKRWREAKIFDRHS